MARNHDLAGQFLQCIVDNPLTAIGWLGIMLPGQQPHDSSMQLSLLCAFPWAASLAAVTPAYAWMSAPARNPDNGHYYAFFYGGTDFLPPGVRPAMPFADALTRAASMSHLGVPGHLATITSQAEQDFVLKYFKELGNRTFSAYDRNFWIAGSDAAVEGEWRWVAGPEAGQQFWQGKADGQALGYQNWLTWTDGRTREPNNVVIYQSQDEDYLALVFGTPEGFPSYCYWNDVSTRDDGMGSVPRIGLVEFSPVPEPASVVMVGGALIALLAARRRRCANAVAESYTLGR